MAISAEFVNPFIDAAISVAAKVAGISMRRGHLAYKRQPDPSYSVSIIIGVYGYLTGQVVYSMKKELADRLVERMLEGCSAAEKQALYQDTLGERHQCPQPEEGDRAGDHHPGHRHGR